MPAKYATANTYTDEELLALYREALAAVAVSGQSYAIANRTFTRADLGEIQKMITWLEGRVNSASTGIAINHAELRRPC